MIEVFYHKTETFRTSVYYNDGRKRFFTGYRLTSTGENTKKLGYGDVGALVCSRDCEE